MIAERVSDQSLAKFNDWSGWANLVRSAPPHPYWVVGLIPYDHTSMLIIGNVKTGNWSKMYALSKRADIAAQVTKIVAGKSD